MKTEIQEYIKKKKEEMMAKKEGYYVSNLRGVVWYQSDEQFVSMVLSIVMGLKRRKLI